MLILLPFIGCLPPIIAVIFVIIRSIIKNHRFYRSFYQNLPFRKFSISDNYVYLDHFREKKIVLFGSLKAIHFAFTKIVICLR
jgi:hypothetical protein